MLNMCLKFLDREGSKDRKELQKGFNYVNINQKLLRLRCQVIQIRVKQNHNTVLQPVLVLFLIISRSFVNQ